MLMASVEFVSDLNLCRRAVLALGELADERAAEILIRLASDNEHALHEAATEAIGHLGRSKHAEAVGHLLERLARGNSGATLGAYRGLRWLDTAAGWAVLRSCAADSLARDRETAIDQLGHNDDPATRDLLLRLIREDSSQEESAYDAARKLFGPDSLEPDEALLQNAYPGYLDHFDDALERVCKRSSPARLFAILPFCKDEDVRKALTRAVLARKEPLVAEARKAIESPDPIVSGLAAHVLGRAGEAARGASKSVDSALSRWWKTWLERRQAPAHKIVLDDDDDSPDRPLVKCLGLVGWAAARLGVGGETVAAMTKASGADRDATEVRRSAVEALGASSARKAADGALEEAAISSGPETRALAAQAVAEDAPERVVPLAEKLLADRAAFGRVARNETPRLTGLLRQAARQSHYQGVVLPYLVEGRDLEGLASLAGDHSLAESARLGAIEGLAALAIESAEATLRQIGLDERDDEDLRKAAWRGLRRSKRDRTPKVSQTKTAEVRG